ncbi:MAG: hypothetical protein JWN15_2143 [Firmicutes bacterium]|nr:hypothetical protein [Bacillota bacterium]
MAVPEVVIRVDGIVTAVSRSTRHSFSKPNQERIRLLAGLGVDGDAHLGVTVQHRSRVVSDPTRPNLRLRAAGFPVPTGARLYLGEAAVVEVTGLRNPCAQLDGFQPGLMAAVLGRDAHGHLIRKAGIMSVVISDGEVRPGDPVRVELPPPPHRPLERV